jgi:hypothetical protein
MVPALRCCPLANLSSLPMESLSCLIQIGCAPEVGIHKIPQKAGNSPVAHRRILSSGKSYSEQEKFPGEYVNRWSLGTGNSPLNSGSAHARFWRLSRAVGDHGDN